MNTSNERARRWALPLGSDPHLRKSCGGEKIEESAAATDSRGRSGSTACDPGTMPKRGFRTGGAVMLPVAVSLNRHGPFHRPPVTQQFNSTLPQSYEGRAGAAQRVVTTPLPPSGSVPNDSGRRIWSIWASRCASRYR